MIGRVAALIALVVAVVAVVVLLAAARTTRSPPSSRTPASSSGQRGRRRRRRRRDVKKIELGPDGRALVTFTVDEEYAPLERGHGGDGPLALALPDRRPPDPADAAGRLPGGRRDRRRRGADQAETVSEVDLDQLFNTLDPETVKDFKHVIQGLELSYDGVGEQANRGFKYLNPFLSTSRRVFAELNSDQRAFENLIVDASQLSGALAARAPTSPPWSGT